MNDIIQYRSFRDQFIECHKNGNLIEVKCPYCENILLVCKLYGKTCNSGNCRKDREKIPDRQPGGHQDHREVTDSL